MTDRATQKSAFLARTGWAGSDLRHLAGDASNRSYQRLTHPVTERPAVLMDAPADKGEDVTPFLRIAAHLRDIGLSAPEVYGEDREAGFLLLEDFGDALFARVLEADPTQERRLYEAATDLLVTLHAAPLPRLEPYDVPLMVDMAARAFTDYEAALAGQVPKDALAAFRHHFTDILWQHAHETTVLVHRDYHAENLIWLPDRDGVARVGLLDFQDAMAGHPAYDLVSVLQDARRDVRAGTEIAMIQRFITATGADEHGFRTAYAVLGVQRNMRILGVFAWLAVDMGKPHYIDLVPRVWDHVMGNLEHPALAPVADLVRGALTAPTPDALDRLRQAGRV